MAAESLSLPERIRRGLCGDNRMGLIGFVRGNARAAGTHRARRRVSSLYGGIIWGSKTGSDRVGEGRATPARYSTESDNAMTWQEGMPARPETSGTGAQGVAEARRVRARRALTEQSEQPPPAVSEPQPPP